MSDTIDAWSISGLLEFEQCPYRAYLKRIKKAPQPELTEDHPMVRGRRIHEEVEAYIRGDTTEFPSSGRKIKDHIEHCRTQYADGKATVEEQWGFDIDWAPTGWFDDNIWCRMATDALVMTEPTAAEVYDWKTGKSFGNEVKYMQQMQLYACGTFLRFPDVHNIDVRLGFLDDGKIREASYERGKKINKLLARFTERGLRMTKCVDFRPKPSAMNCKYCPFGSANGTSQCVYAVE